jgi:hypothetical protein
VVKVSGSTVEEAVVVAFWFVVPSWVVMASSSAWQAAIAGPLMAKTAIITTIVRLFVISCYSLSSVNPGSNPGLAAPSNPSFYRENCNIKTKVALSCSAKRI